MHYDRFLPWFADDTTRYYDHWEDFAVELIKHKKELIALPRAEGRTASDELLDHILDAMLAVTIPRAFEVPHYDQRPSTVLLLLSTCIPGNRVLRG